ncbi:MAG: protein phosphatase [Rhodobacterales bacterium]
MSGKPFQIFQLPGFSKGLAGLCKQPKCDANFKTIAAWKTDMVVSLTETAEFPAIKPSLAERFSAARYDWLHLPIVDFSTPSLDQNTLWQLALARMKAVLDRNGKVLVHCRGGRGRSGMVLLKLLILQGEDPEIALARLRKIRAGAVETDAQALWATMPL